MEGAEKNAAILLDCQCLYSSLVVQYCEMPSLTSARLRACSQAFRPSSTSTVPPTLPSAPTLFADAHVFTTKLVLASSGYDWPETYEECKALRSVVVETCVETFCIVFDRGVVEPLFE